MYEGKEGTILNIDEKTQNDMGQTDSSPPAISDDGFWQLVNREWVPTDKQLEALSMGAKPHQDANVEAISNLAPVTLSTDTVPMPGVQLQYGQPMTIVTSNSGNKSALISVGIVVGIVILLVVASAVLYVWASSLANEQDDNLVGTWTNPVDKIVFSSNGDASETTGTFDSWQTQDDTLYFFEGDEYEYLFQYSVVDDVLFMAPLGSADSVIGEECIAYLRGETGSDNSIFEDRIEGAIIPNWCTSE